MESEKIESQRSSAIRSGSSDSVINDRVCFLCATRLITFLKSSDPENQNHFDDVTLIFFLFRMKVFEFALLVLVCVFFTGTFSLDSRPSPKAIQRPRFFNLTYKILDDPFPFFEYKYAKLNISLNFDKKRTVNLAGGLSSYGAFYLPTQVGGQSFDLLADTGFFLKSEPNNSPFFFCFKRFN